MTRSTTAPSREERYRRLLRWYPARWRALNEEAMLGVLLDQADATGRSRPPLADRFSLFVGGLAQQLQSGAHRRRGTVIPLAASVAFSLFYFTLIGWSPDTAYPGSVGPFGNPSILAAVVVVVALVVASRGNLVMARGTALFAALLEVVIAVLGGPLEWMGPSAPTALLVAGMAVLAAVPWPTRRAVITATGVWLALVCGMFLLENVAVVYLQAAFPGLNALPVASVALLLAAAAVTVLAMRRARWSERLVASRQSTSPDGPGLGHE